ncbi:MAG: PD-(D/E)XK nuclease family protein [Syntrophales bacterium]|nr:PD-(D/E)XK nuclease family protein [Syntrophales bacterium]
MAEDLSKRLWLTSTERLARNIQRSFRGDFLKEGSPGWERADVISLNTWLNREWTGSWPEKLPAPDLLRMALWRTVIENIPPPDPMEKSINLCRSLDDTFSVLARHKIDPRSGAPSSPLVDWRKTASRRFYSLLEEKGLFHPAETALFVAGAIKEGAIPLPRDCSIMGFEFPAPIEIDLFSLLRRMSRLTMEDPRKPSKGNVTAFALPTPDQETTFLGTSIVEDARRLPLHRIGVIVPDLEKYGSSLSPTLEDILGKSRSAKESWFNITLGKPLSELPLFRASLLPFRFFLEGEDRELFLSLILSPYYRYLQSTRAVAARADRAWRSNGIPGNMDDLSRCLSGANEKIRKLLFQGPAQSLYLLRTDMKKKTAPLSYWMGAMTRTWDALGFPVISDETDQLAWRHACEIKDHFLSHMGDTLFDAGEFLQWYIHRASLETTQPERAEDAGVQVMGIIESRGLDFDKVYLLDVNDRSLPRSVRPLPFLDSAERARIQGGTPQSQFEFAKAAVKRILHSAPDIVFLRAEQDDMKPLTPSPFWPAKHEKKYVNIWIEPDPSLMRVPWLRAAWEGVSAPEIDGKTIMPGVDRLPLKEPLLNRKLSRGLSPSRLKRAISCPFMFLVRDLLGIEPMEEVVIPPSHMERGELLHSILASFTEKLRSRNLNPAEDRDGAWNLISECVDKALEGLPNHPNRRLEKRRLLGSPEDRFPGILEAWLELEAEHRAAGWTCVAEEVDFDGLSLEGSPFNIRGRIDRIDFNENEGLLCLDYKTGNLPPVKDIIARFTEPQLAVYLMAIQDSDLRNLEGKVDSSARYRAGAGYIQVRSLNEIGYRLLGNIADTLPGWRSIIAETGKRIAEGLFEPYPYPLSEVKNRNDTCVSCVCRCLCPRGLSTLSAENEEDKPLEGQTYE